MRFGLLVSLLLISNSLHLFAQERLSLPEALARHLVQISVRGSGGFQGECLQVAIKNLKSEIVSLDIPSGYIFASKDSAVQNLMVTASRTMTIDPYSVKRTRLFTMCTQSYNMSPRRGAEFLAGKMAEGSLLDLAQKISNRGYQNSTAQSAVWTLANGESSRHIYGQDTSMVRDLALTVSEATGVPLTEFILEPRSHQITSIRTSMEVLIPKHLQRATLGLYDAQGQLIREYFSQKAVEMGFMQWRVGASHSLGDSAELYLRLMEGEELISEKQVFVSDSITPLQRIHSEAVMIYSTDTDVQAKVGIYDSEDRLYFILAGDRHIPKGTHRSRFIAGKSLPYGPEYFVKIKVGDQVLASQVLDVNSPPPTLYPKRVVKGKASFHLKQEITDGLLAIYDDKDRLKRVLYEIPSMRPGNKSFSYFFQHRQGKGASFFLRLTDKDGKLVIEKEIRD
ncbi:MAG: hypothetical protein AAF587_04525 [Bacteroidota bacterium]